MSSTPESKSKSISYKTHHKKSFKRGRRPVSSVSTSTSRSVHSRKRKSLIHPHVSLKRRRSLSSECSRNGRRTRDKELRQSKNNSAKREKQSSSKKRTKKKHRRRKSELIVRVNDIIADRFKVVKVLGEGSFGQVLDCFDQFTDKNFAIKALKPLENYKSAAMHEIEVLKLIASSDNHLKSCCIFANDFIEWNKYFFILFPKLGKSVFSFLEANKYRPYPCKHAVSITSQVLHATKFLHDLGLTHTDLKPENILFVNDSYEEKIDEKGKKYRILNETKIKIIDFGSATFENQHHSRIIQTRHYRAPEVILELGWSYPVDVWSIGCILFELITGKCMFMTHENLEHLAMMERVLGPIPKSMIKSSKRQSFFYKDRLDWNSDSRDGRYVKKNVKHLSHYWFNCDSREKRLGFDLVQEMLIFKPHHRVTISNSLKHPFFKL